MARPALEVPGAVERATRTMALRQLARATDIARTVCWLSSPTAATHVTGQIITVAGGMEGRLLWDEADVDRTAILARLDRD
jgi:3-oxoacyl-[acyl-carrier protein] reductase